MLLTTEPQTDHDAFLVSTFHQPELSGLAMLTLTRPYSGPRQSRPTLAEKLRVFGLAKYVTPSKDSRNIYLQSFCPQAFQVVTALAGPALARIGDTCGRRYVILFGIFMGGVGVIIISVAPNVNVAIAGACVSRLTAKGRGVADNASTRSLDSATAQVSGSEPPKCGFGTDKACYRWKRLHR